MRILLLFMIYKVNSEAYVFETSAASALDHNLSKLNLVHNPSCFLNPLWVTMHNICIFGRCS